MTRAPFQTLIIPYRPASNGGWAYLLMRRADAGYWQPVAGGGEGSESREQAARREAREEAGVPQETTLLQLVTMEHIRVTEFKDSPAWGEDVYVIPQYCFGAAVQPDWEPTLSHEHSEYGWFSFEEAHSLLRFDGNRTALWELDRRLRGRGPRGVETLARARQGHLPAAWQTRRLVVRDAQLQDAAGLYEVFNGWRNTAALDPTFSPVTRDDLTALIQRSLAETSREFPERANEFRLQTAFEQGRDNPAGFFHLSHGRPRAELAWLSMFVVDARRQRQGLGAELASGLLTHLETLGYAACRLRVFFNNLPALNFWQRLEFRHLIQVEESGGLVLERRFHDV